MTVYLGDHHGDATLSQALSEASFEVRTFTDGLDLYYAILEKPPALVTCELMLPSLDGFVLARLVHFDSRLAHLPIVCLTWFDQPDLDERLDRLGCRHLLRRPVEPQRLVSLARSISERPALA